MAKKITKKQRDFAVEYAKTGNGVQSALKAYDTDSPIVADSIARENLEKPRVMALLESFAERAAQRDFELMDQNQNLGVAMSAVKDILDRTGYKPVEKSVNAFEGNVQITWGGDEV